MIGEFNPFSLSEKTILVTGASSGIGQTLAVLISKMGGRVIATGRDLTRLQQTFDMMEGEGHSIIVSDLTVSRDINLLASSVPMLDGIAHCAGIGRRMPAKMINQEEVDVVMHTNFYSAVLLQSALLTNKRIKRDSSIVFVASKAADYPSIGNSLYSASKGAIISYARCLALELAPHGIRVNCICPAMVWTQLVYQNEVTEQQLHGLEKAYPLKRYGKPEDIANLAIYLLSDASSWMTNSCIDITGGAICL